MKRIKKEVVFEWLFLGTLWVSEYAGIQIALFTPDFPLPLPLLALWILVQAGVSFCLLSQVWHAVRGRQKEAGRLCNIVVICVALQGLGLFRSHQLFAAAAAISDSFLLYLTYHWD